MKLYTCNLYNDWNETDIASSPENAELT